MINLTTIQRGLDLFNLMTMDPEEIWAALDATERVTVEAAFQQFSARAEAIQHEQDADKALRDLQALAADCIQLVINTPALRELLPPKGIQALDDPGVLGVKMKDLGDSENERRAAASKAAAQVSNDLVTIQKAANPKQK